MELTGLIYASTATEHCNPSEIDAILETARNLNATNNLTGVLYFSSEFFLQYLEGDLAKIEDTYTRLTKDPRHTAIRLIDKTPIETRKLSEWSMGYVPQSELLVPLNMKFMDGTNFNPQNISAAQAMELILELRDQLPKAHYD